MAHYILHVNGKGLTVFPTIEEAKAAGQDFVAAERFVHIESPAAPAPTRAWRYDAEVSTWVETTCPLEDAAA